MHRISIDGVPHGPSLSPIRPQPEVISRYESQISLLVLLCDHRHPQAQLEYNAKVHGTRSTYCNPPRTCRTLWTMSFGPFLTISSLKTAPAVNCGFSQCWDPEFTIRTCHQQAPDNSMEIPLLYSATRIPRCKCLDAPTEMGRGVFFEEVTTQKCLLRRMTYGSQPAAPEPI